jgi:hypothetical protein
VTVRVDVAPKNVDEALAGALHAEAKANIAPVPCRGFRPGNTGAILFRAGLSTQILRSRRSNRVEETACSPPSRLQGSVVGAGSNLVWEVRLRPASERTTLSGSGCGETDFACLSARFGCRDLLA